MNLKDFGKLVKALRSDHLDENLHIWSREKLSEETKEAGDIQLSPQQIGKIERGERKYLRPEELLTLANALQLTSFEREKFFIESTGIENEKIYRSSVSPQSVLNDIQGDMQDTPLPFYINDAFNDVVVANTPILALLQFTEEIIEQAGRHPIGFNELRIVFDEDTGFRKVVGDENWRFSVRRDIRLFRGVSLPYRATPYFNYIITNLRRMRNFRGLWEEIYWLSDQPDFNVGSVRFKYNHPNPAWGHVDYTAVPSQSITSAGALITYTYVPRDMHTMKVFSEIGEQYGIKHHRLAPWPEKTIPKPV